MSLYYAILNKSFPACSSHAARADRTPHSRLLSPRERSSAAVLPGMAACSFENSRSYRRIGARPSRSPPCSRQLRHSQNQNHQAVAGPVAALPSSFHPDLTKSNVGSACSRSVRSSAEVTPASVLSSTPSRLPRNPGRHFSLRLKNSPSLRLIFARYQ